jgi:3-oxoadipate enol-lactonase
MRQMYLRDEGSGVAVVLVHGLGASSRIFDHLFDRRPAGLRLLALDLPRTARSGPWAPSRPEPIAELLAGVLADPGVGAAHVFGHSFGALVALALATRRPALIESLTLASSPALGLPVELRLWLDSPFAKVAGAFWGQAPLSGAMLPTYLGFLWGRPEALTDAQVAVYRDAQRADGFGAGVVEALRAVGAFRLDAPALRTASFPKAILWGDRDPLVPVTVGARIAEAIGATLTVLEGVGHCVPDERPEVIGSLVERWADLASRAA